MITSSGRKPLVVATLLTAVWLAVHAGFWLVPEVFEALRDKVTDRLFTLRADLGSGPNYDDTIVHVSIEDRGLEASESFYFGRVEHAELIESLARAGVAAQLHDVIFARPQPGAGDAELIEATAAAGHVYYGMALALVAGDRATEPAEIPAATREVLERNHWSLSVTDGGDGLFRSTRHFLTFPALATTARGLGYLDILPDRDGVYRHAPLFVRDGEAFLPSMPMRIICDYLGVDPDGIDVDPGRTVTLRGALRPGESEPSDIVIPIDHRGRVVLNFLGPWGSMTHYPFDVILQASDDRFMMEDLRDELSGKIAIVSWVATGAGDVGPVPVDPVYPLSGIHAAVMHSILTGAFLRELSSTQMFFWVELPLLLILFAGGIRFSTIPFLALTALLTAGYAVASAFAFIRAGLILDVPGPIAIIIGACLHVAAYQYHVESGARAMLHHTLEAYFPPSVVAEMVAHPGTLLDQARKKELTILFSDIVSFTAHTANTEPGHVRKLLNEYFEQMAEIVFRHQGTLDKFIGDGLLVFFGDPEPLPDHAERGVRAAIDMQRAAVKLAEEWKRRGDIPLAIRVGINTGEVIVGNMGSAKRLSYTVVGEPVNLAQRLESAAPAGGILISARTHELARDSIDARPREPIQAKGIDHPVEVYEVPS